MHNLGASLKDGVELGAGFQDFPCAFEPCRDNESGTGTELPSIAPPVFEHHPAFGEATEFRLGVPDAPLSGRARPSAGEELLGGVGEIIGDGLPGIAGEQPVGGGGGRLSIHRGGEVDDECVVGGGCYWASLERGAPRAAR